MVWNRLCLTVLFNVQKHATGPPTHVRAHSMTCIHLDINKITSKALKSKQQLQAYTNTLCREVYKLFQFMLRCTPYVWGIQQH